MTSRRDHWFAWGWSVAIVTLYAARSFLPYLLREDWQHGDLYQHVWWTHRFADPDLFPHDLLYRLFSGYLLAPMGYQAIYRLFVPLSGPERVAEVLPFVLAALLATLVFLLGRRAANGANFGGVAAVTVLSVSQFLPMYAGQGLPRYFAMPLLALFVWALGGERRLLVGECFLAAALFYPPAVVVMGFAFLVHVGPALVRDRQEWRRWLLAAVPVAVAAGILLVVYARPLPAGIGPKISAEVARSMAEFGDGGRSAFFVSNPWDYWFANFRSGIGIGPTKVFCFGAVLLFASVSFRRLLPREMWSLLAGGLLGFILAHLTLFSLHMPSRYTKVVIHLFFLIFVGALAERLRGWLATTAVGRYVGRRAAAVLAVVLLVGLGVSAVNRIHHDLALPPVPGRMAALHFLSELPKETLVAAFPDDADPVPLVARRSVLTSLETSLPWWLGYYRQVSARLDAVFTATLATNWEDVDVLYARYGVDVFLVNQERFTEAGCRYAEPFGSRVAERYQRGKQQGFVLSNPPEDRILFRDGDWMVVRVGPDREVTDG